MEKPLKRKFAKFEKNNVDLCWSGAADDLCNNI